MHVMETFIDIFELPVVCDIFVNLECSCQITCRILASTIHCNEVDRVYTLSTNPGISVLPLTPPKAVPRQVRPVTFMEASQKFAVWQRNHTHELESGKSGHQGVPNA